VLEVERERPAVGQDERAGAGDVVPEDPVVRLAGRGERRGVAEHLAVAVEPEAVQLASDREPDDVRPDAADPGRVVLGQVALVEAT